MTVNEIDIRKNLTIMLILGSRAPWRSLYSDTDHLQIIGVNTSLSDLSTLMQDTTTTASSLCTHMVRQPGVAFCRITWNPVTSKGEVLLLHHAFCPDNPSPVVPLSPSVSAYALRNTSNTYPVVPLPESVFTYFTTSYDTPLIDDFLDRYS